MYLTLSGKILECPGRADKNYTVATNIREEKSLKDAWMKSNNYKRATGTIKSPENNDLNYHCVARDGYSLPKGFYKEIEQRVIEYFSNKKK
jgi:hypothetical protein